MKDKLIANRLFRYLAAGGTSYAIELSSLLILHRFGGLSVEAATAIAFWIGLATSFVLQKIFAFKDYQRTIGVISRQLVGYAVLVAINYAFTLAVVAAFPAKLIIFSRSLALVVTTAWNYAVYKILFKESKSGFES